MKKVLLMLFLLVYSNVAMADLIPCNYKNPMLSHVFWQEATLEDVKKQVESGYSLNDTECGELPPLVQAVAYAKGGEIIEYMITSGAKIPRLVKVVLGRDRKFYATNNLAMSCDFCNHYQAIDKKDALRHGYKSGELVYFRMNFVDYAYEKGAVEAAEVIMKHSPYKEDTLSHRDGSDGLASIVVNFFEDIYKRVTDMIAGAILNILFIFK